MPAFSPPVLARLAYPELRWNFPPGEKKLYITFDDGPSPDTTPEVLYLLDKWKAKASFFCLGIQAEQFPELLHAICHDGHTIGNHSFSHPDGFKMSTHSFLSNINQAAKTIHSSLFRPPYGRIWPWQLKAVMKEYEVVMWNVMSMDYDPHYSKEDILRHLRRNTSDGSVIVFHENTRAKSKLPGILETFLAEYAEKEFSFAAIAEQDNKRIEG